MAKFFVVATPIGNLEDITLRALRVLKEVDLILCEDTRTTRLLLDRYGIKTPTLSYHARSGFSKAEKIIGLLGEGKNLALVSDAGTPGLSDPGAALVEAIRRRLPETEVNAVPGPSALAAALSVAGAPIADFVFLGFLPNKKGREKLFDEIAVLSRPVIFYESPHRIMKTLNSLAARLGERRRVLVARELTKIHEEVFHGTAAEVRRHYEENPDRVRGEFVVMVF